MLPRQDHERVTAGRGTPGQSMEATLPGLLDREPNEATRHVFDFRAISKYLPEFEAAFSRYLALSEPLCSGSHPWSVTRLDSQAARNGIMSRFTSAGLSC